MDKKKVRKWVKALESRKYKQGKGELYSNDRYCCLGVACAALLGDKHPTGGTLTGQDEYEELAREILPDVSGNMWDGFNSKVEDKLTGLNDSGKKPFPYIARWIRKNILGEDVIIDMYAYNRRRGFKKGTK